MIPKARVSLVITLFLLLVLVGNSKAAEKPVFYHTDSEALLYKVENAHFFAGSVSGTVVEAGSNEPLIGASVVIKGTLKGTATDQEGGFIIRGVEEGVQTLTISYLGFQKKEVEIEISNGTTVEVNVEMEWEGVEGEQITITAQARGQVAAINEQLTSNTISNIVAKDRIQEMPDVNAAESIGRLPGIAIERSGGEATRVAVRGLSPKFSTVTVNGVRVPSTGSDDRSVDLSLISSNMLDGIEVKKAITPDMDADAVAGSIDLKLRDAPEGFRSNLQVQGGYAELQDYYGNYKVSGSLSNRFFDNKLGIIATFSTDEYDRSADRLNASYRTVTNTIDRVEVINLNIETVGLTEENSVRGRTGGSLLLDYKIPNGKISANTFYNHQQGESLTRSNDYFNRDGRSGISMNIQNFETNIMTNALAINQELGRFKLDAGVSYTLSNSESPRNYYFNFRREANSVEGWNDLEDGPGAKPLDVRPFVTPDSSSTWLANTEVFDNSRKENSFTTQLNLQQSFDLGEKLRGSFKAGFKYRYLYKENDENRSGKTNWQYESFSTNGSGTQFLECAANNTATGLFNGYDLYQAYLDGGYQYLPIALFMDDYSRPAFLNGDFPVGYTVNYNELIRFTNAVENCALSTNTSETAFRENVNASRGNDYDGFETYTAGYVMGTFEIGKYLTFIPGVRITNDKSEFTAERFREVNINNQPRPPAELDTLTANRDYTFVLPMLHLQVDPTDWLKIRLARTETISRPNFQQLIPRTNVNFNLTQIQANNTDLKPSHSLNHDISISAYRNKLGLFTVSYFTKKISDDIRWYRFNSVSADSIPLGLNIPDGSEEGESDWLSEKPQIDTYINNPYKTYYDGWEFDWQTNFWYLPSVLKGLVLNINFSFINSKYTYINTLSEQVCVSGCDGRRPRFETVYYDTTASGRAQSQPGRITNITVGYDYKGFSTRLSYLSQTDRVASFNAFTPIFSTYTDDYYRWDLTIKQRLPRNIELYVNLINLTSVADKNFAGGEEFKGVAGYRSPTYEQYFGFTGDIGIRVEF